MLRRLIVLAALTSPLALRAQESFDRAMVAKIRDEGMNRSHAWAMIDTLATVVGPRLTATPAYIVRRFGREITSPHGDSRTFTSRRGRSGADGKCRSSRSR